MRLQRCWLFFFAEYSLRLCWRLLRQSLVYSLSLDLFLKLNHSCKGSLGSFFVGINIASRHHILSNARGEPFHDLFGDKAIKLGSHVSPIYQLKIRCYNRFSVFFTTTITFSVVDRWYKSTDNRQPLVVSTVPPTMLHQNDHFHLCFVADTTDHLAPTYHRHKCCHFCFGSFSIFNHGHCDF